MTAQTKHLESSSVPIRILPGYSVTTDGKVISHRPWRGASYRELRQFRTTDGYFNVHANTPHGGRRRYPVHKLVAEAFLPPRPTPDHEIRHVDGNPLNNTASNLSWGTRQENADDRERHGRTSRGNGHAERVKAGLARRRLIAAAPELLAACEAALETEDFKVGNATLKNVVAMKPAFDLLRAAIAKARGES